MGMQHVTLQSRPPLTPSQIADLRLAASKLTGPERRSFEAAMTLKYCAGNPLMAEAVFGLSFTHIFSLRLERTHNTVHGSEICEMLKPLPQHRRAGFAIAPATHKAPELGNPVYRLPQRGRLWRWGRDVMDGAIERLPFLQFQQYRAGSVGNNTAQHGGIENPPGNHAIQRQTPLEPLGSLQLPGFDATAAFQNFMPDLYTPATGVPVHPCQGFCRRVDRTR